MQYFLSFLEGIATFISPCLLPMIPIYVSYFGGGGANTSKTIRCALGFILGFTAVFTAMGALAGTVGAFLVHYRTAVNIVCGIAVIFFGLNYIGVLKFNLFGGARSSPDTTRMGFFSSVLFGVIFSVGWTPCVGTFLGTALMMASGQGRVLEGTLMLLVYSLGLGIPFFICAMLIDRLKNVFAFIKRNYRTINTVCGIFLIIIGVAMATGMLGKLLSLLG